MTAENVIFGVMASLPVLATLGVYLFFRRYRLHAGRSCWWLRLLAGNMLVLALLISALVLFGECYYRFAYDTPDSLGLLKTSERWFRRHYKMNANGFRDNVEIATEIPFGKRRVTFIGDSFTAGHGIKNVDDRFVNIVRHDHLQWDVQAVAANGWDTSRQIKMLATMIGVHQEGARPQRLQVDPSGRIILGRDAQGRRLLGKDDQGRLVMREPARDGEKVGRLFHVDDLEGRLSEMFRFDIVVLVYCLNDVTDLMPETPNIGRRITEDSKPGWLAEHSFLFNTVHYRLFIGRDPDLNEFYRFTRAAYSHDNPVWQSQSEQLEVVNTMVKTGGGQLLVVTFPFLDQLGTTYPFTEAHELLDAHWRRLGVPHLDLLDVYAKFDPATITVSRFDAHPNEYAQKLAAEAISRFIEKYVTP